MLEKWIASSIDDLNVSMIMEYATYKGYTLKEEEAKVIEVFLKENYQALIKKDRSCFLKVQEYLSNETYAALINVYEEAIQTYL